MLSIPFPSLRVLFSPLSGTPLNSFLGMSFTVVGEASSVSSCRWERLRWLTFDVPGCSVYYFARPDSTWSPALLFRRPAFLPSLRFEFLLDADFAARLALDWEKGK